MIAPLSIDAIRGLYTTLAGQTEECIVALGECFFHTIEALVEVEEAEGIDPMPLFVLRAFEFAQPADAEHLDGLLHIGRQLMRQILNGMVADGLVAGESESTYCLTNAGRHTLQTGQVIRRTSSRRQFRFLHPHMNYVAVRELKGAPLKELSPGRVPSPWEFSPDVLRKAIAQSADWKRRHAFPANIADVVTEPRSPEATEPAAPETGSAVAPATPPQGRAAPVQHLIVDKAQMATCALVIRRASPNDAPLSGYPVSGQGKLLRTNAQPLFSLHDPDDVKQAFPGLLEPPSSKEVLEAWLSLAARLNLPEAEPAGMKFENDSLVITLSEDQLDPWRNLIVLAMQDQPYWQVSQTPMIRLCKVAVMGADSVTTACLQVLRSVLSLEQDSRRPAIVKSEDSLREWLATQRLPHDPSSSRDLANTAFRFGRFRLAYEISEIEDMSDATVPS